MADFFVHFEHSTASAWACKQQRQQQTRHQRLVAGGVSAGATVRALLLLLPLLKLHGWSMYETHRRVMQVCHMAVKIRYALLLRGDMVSRCLLRLVYLNVFVQALALL